MQSSILVQVIRGIPRSSTLVQIFGGIPRSSTLVRVFSGIFLSSSLVRVISGTSIPRQFVPCRNYQKRLSPVTGAAFPAGACTPISCQSLRLALTGSNSEALWQQLAQTSSRKPCNVPGHELFSAFFRAGNFAAYTTGSETCLKHQKQENRRFQIKDIINIGNALKLRYRCYFREKASPLLHGHIARIPCAGLR